MRSLTVTTKTVKAEECLLSNMEARLNRDGFLIVQKFGIKIIEFRIISRTPLTIRVTKLSDKLLGMLVADNWKMAFITDFQKDNCIEGIDYIFEVEE